MMPSPLLRCASVHSAADGHARPAGHRISMSATRAMAYTDSMFSHWCVPIVLKKKNDEFKPLFNHFSMIIGMVTKKENRY